MKTILPFREMRQRAESGEILAQIMFGFLCEHGLRMAPDKEEAKHWYECAAQQGSPAAQYALACLIEEDDPKEAMSWLRKAVDTDFPPAQFRLGWYLELGQIVDRDLASAAEWVHRAADAGFIPAMMHLSYMYEEGVGVEPNDDLAMNYIRQAAEAGSASGALALGMRSIDREGESRDEALDWIWKAANADHEFANMFLARMYAGGLHGARKDERLKDYFYQKSKPTSKQLY